MKKILLNFRALVTEQLQLTEPATPEVIAAMLSLKKRLVDSCWIIACSFKHDGCAQRYFKQLQREAILLADKIYHVSEVRGASAFCSVAHHSMVEILEGLQEHYPNYFDGNQVIPRYLADETKSVLCEKIERLKVALKSRKIGADLQQLILFPYLNFSTYTQKEYVLKFIDPLIASLQGQWEEEALLFMLYRSGLNTNTFNTYYKKKIVEKVKETSSGNAQLELLYDYEGLFRGMPKPKLHYEDKSKYSCRAAMLKFIRAEITCLHNKQKLIVPRAEMATTPADFVLKTSLNSEGFAYLLRLLVETDVIWGAPRTQLFTFMAANVQTRGKGEGTISVVSLSTKYRQVTRQTAVGVKSVLANMMKQVQQNFNV